MSGEKIEGGNWLRGKATWGFFDQALSSATNFGLSLIAARALGPKGLGVVAIGFSGYLIALGFQRTLVSEPLVVTSSAVAQGERKDAANAAATAAVALSTLVVVCMVLTSIAVSGSLGRGLLLFSPWILPALLQDLWRSILFRDSRGPSATRNDLLWFLSMVILLPVAWTSASDWMVVAWWGTGALLGSMLGLLQIRPSFVPLLDGWKWWRREAWPLGRWLTAESAVFVLAAQGVIFLIAAALGASDVGGLRAAQTVFAPLSLLAPALTLPGLPAIRTALGASFESAKGLALKMSAGLFALTALYVILISVFSQRLLSLVFGSSFVQYNSLLLPMAAQQLLLVTGLGSYLLLKAAQRGGAILVSRTIEALLTLTATFFLAWHGGLLEAAWGLAAGTGAGALSFLVFSLRAPAAPSGFPPGEAGRLAREWR